MILGLEDQGISNSYLGPKLFSPQSSWEGVEKDIMVNKAKVAHS